MCKLLLNLFNLLPVLQIAEHQQDAVARTGERVRMPGMPKTVVAGAGAAAGRICGLFIIKMKCL